MMFDGVNNFVAVGEVVSDAVISHVGFDGEEFYMFFLFTVRNSGVRDVFKCVAKKNLAKKLKAGDCIELYGRLSTRNVQDVDKNHVDTYVYASEIYSAAEGKSSENRVFLDGFICKPPVYRETPLGREIADVLLAVNRPYGKSDYIHCVFWGRSARAIIKKTVSDEIIIRGRLQSREYGKDGKIRTAFEVSADSYWTSKDDLTEDMAAEWQRNNSRRTFYERKNQVNDL